MGVIQFKGGSIQFKGGTGTIQFKNLGKVANPTVDAYWNYNPISSYYFKSVKVTNNDTETVSVYAGLQESNLQSKGPSATSGNYLVYEISEPFPVKPVDEAFTGYVQLRAAGRLDSDIISDEYINPNQITNPTVHAFWQTDFTSGDYYKAVKVTNNYTQAVSVYAGLSSLELQSGTLAAGASATYVLSGAVNQTAARMPFTAQAQLKATGKIDSEVISDNAEGIF